MTDLSMKVARGARFRHVIFKGCGGGRRHAVNMAPRLDRTAVGRATETSSYWSPVPRLSGEEERFVDALFARGGLEVTSYRQETLRRRLPACQRVLQAITIEQAHARLDGANDAVVNLAINAMVIGVTSFFRDAPVFRYLRDNVIGPMPRAGRQPRIWSAGCSDGEELYSVAMLLVESDLLDRSYLLGTDCRAVALERARDARYDARTLREVPRERLHRHFQPPVIAAGAESRRIRDEIRAAVQWRRGDVTRICEPGAFDVILCRNLAMYLTPDVAAALWQRLERALRPGGYLVLGKAERPIGAGGLVPVAPCVFRRGGN